jgi:hypothetical protein
MCSNAGLLSLLDYRQIAVFITGTSKPFGTNNSIQMARRKETVPDGSVGNDSGLYSVGVRL